MLRTVNKPDEPFVPRLTAEGYAAEIARAWGEGVACFVKAGQTLVEAKEQLPYGEFGRMVSAMLPFSWRTANRLMAIAHHQILSNSTHASNLPPSWATLYDLTRIPLPILEAALADGRIHPGMERK